MPEDYQPFLPACYSRHGCQSHKKCNITRKCEVLEAAKQSREHPDDMPKHVNLKDLDPSQYEDIKVYPAETGLGSGPIFGKAPEPPLYCVFSPDDGQGFKIGRVIKPLTQAWLTVEVQGDEEPWAVYDYMVVAQGYNWSLLKTNMLAAQTLEQELRPAWQFALEHAERIKNDMLARVWARAKGGLK